MIQVSPQVPFGRIAAPRIATALAVFLALLTPTVFDWSVSSAVGIDVSPGALTPEQIEKMKAMRAQAQSAKSGKPENKPDEKKSDEKKGEKADEKKKEDEVKTVKRPTGEAGRLDPARHKLEPDAEGRIQFNYNGHPWANVLQEYADAANLSFDYQELPPDELNLTTRRKYRLDEARNLLNQHLLARGFTLLLQGELLMAVKIDKLDPSLVPRVDADDLENHLPYDFMRVTFSLPPSMAPDKAKDDVKSLLSPNAKVTPLLASKRLLVIDAVANLRDVRDLFYAEQSALDQMDKPREFHLKHRRAEYVADMVMVVLGLDPATRKTPQELQLETQKMQMLQQLQKKGKDISKMLKQEGPPVYIAVNRRLNSLLINAPPELMPIIERTIKRFDVPEEFGVVNQLPTVAADKLDELQPNEVVRVRFQLPITMNPTDVAEEIQPLVGPNAKVLPLLASRRLLVNDTVENLREVRDALRAKEAALKTLETLREFPIKHHRAEDLAGRVLTLLDITPNTVSNPRGTRFQWQSMKLFISLNHQRNSLQVSAQPELLAMFEAAIRQLDVPDDGEAIPGADQQTMLLYEVTGQNVQSVIRMLDENTNLGPLTRLQTGPANETLYATASQADHEKIREFLDKIAPKSIQRVEADKLEEYPAHEIVRVRFQLPMTTDMLVATTQVEGILGTSGKVQSLESSKQLDVIDTVANLIEVRDVVQAEAEALAEQDNIREFRLKHRRAVEMVDQVLTMIGLDPETIRYPQEKRLELQKLKLFISANEQRNSLIVNAPPDKMRIVEQIVKQLDVPMRDETTAGADRQTMVPYKVVERDVNAVIKVLTEIGNLGPQTRLEGDATSKTLYAFASQEDHDKIRQFIDKLDPNLVPRVEADRLEEHPVHLVARVRFQLPLTADVVEAAKQVSEILGTGGKVQSLESSKQLVVVDTVANLLEIRDVLRAEEAALSAQKNVREFPLQHRRAEEMVEQVLTMVGLDPATISYPQELRLELQKLKLFITANQRRNSLLVNAPADKMLMVEKIVEQLDVPERDARPEQANRQTMVPYHVATEDVSSVVKALMEIGDMGPRTRLQGDPYGEILYAFASQEDHRTIRQFIDKLDPSLVASVEADDLEDHAPHDVVRVRFQLPLSSDISQSAEQIEGMLGSDANVQSLDSSKQLVVVDTVSNLIDVRGALYAEQLAAQMNELPRSFPLRHRRANYVADQVMILLGLDPDSRKSTTQVQLESQRMQMMMQNFQQKGRDISKLGKSDVFIAVNRRENSLLVNAPPEKMPMIERAIRQIDVPRDDVLPIASGPLTMKKYLTVTASTDSIIRALEDVGNLDPKTQLQTDPGSRTIFAYATAADHEVIHALLKDLDGSGRFIKVIWLPRRLPAEQVAGSIMELIIGPKEDDKDDDLPWYYYGRRNRDKKDESPNKGFSILPDVENNRLLVKATELEHAEVDNLIAMLQRNADGTIGDSRRVRRFEARGDDVTRRLLEELKSTWTGDNPLKIEVAPQEEPAKEKKVDEKKKEDKVTGKPRASRQKFWLTQNVVEQQANEAPNETKSAPAIRISVNEKGEITIASEDTEALNRLQGLMEELAPSEPEFHRFKLRYVYADTVRFNLEDYFKDELDQEEGDPIRDWWGRWKPTTPEKSPLTLGKRPPLRFIDDYSTNTIIVANASPSQLRVIKDLISFYDTPPIAEEYRRRRTIAIPIKYSRAEDIAKALKEVYRELLSSKDKEFEDEEGNTPIGGKLNSYVFEDATTMAGGQLSPVFVKFEGMLSIGVDEISNILLVSAREEILEDIKQTVEALDQGAKPDTVVHVYEIRGIIPPDELQKTLAETLGNPWTGGKPTKAGSGGQKKAKPPQEKSGKASTSKKPKSGR